jgi:carbon-monoxide dehydrogenase medium subunit
VKAAAFDYHAPGSVEEVLALLARHGDEARIIAGGQSLVPVMTSRLARPSHLLDINRIPRAERPTVSAGRLRIPPLMRHVDFRDLEVEGPITPILAELSDHVAPLPVRMRGTFCGAVAHADPSSEWCLATVVLGAELIARSKARGVRNIPAQRFFESIMTTALADDEMLVEVQIPLLPATVRHGFAEVSPRAGDYGLALALAVYARDEKDIINARIGVGGVEAAPRRLQDAEAMLYRREPSRRLFREVADAAAELVDPVGDVHADANYRRDLTRAVVLRALEQTL